MLHPVDGLEVQTLLPTDYRPPLTSRSNQPRPSSQTQKSNSGGLGGSLQFVDGLAGVVAPGKLVIDHRLAIALGVLAPVWGKLRLYVHFMMFLD